LKQALAVTIVVVTHELASAFLIADRIIVLDAGHIIAAAPPASEDEQAPRIQQFLNRVADTEAGDDVDPLQLFTD